MEILAPIIVTLVVEYIKKKCRDKYDKTDLMNLAASAGEIPWRVVRKATRQAARDIYGKRYWRENKAELLTEARHRMEAPEVVAEVMDRAFAE